MFVIKAVKPGMLFLIWIIT